jgi:hypothetical protein
MKGTTYSEESYHELGKAIMNKKFVDIEKDYPKLEIDERILVVKTPPIRYARIKNQELQAVSIGVMNCKLLNEIILTNNISIDCS